MRSSLAALAVLLLASPALNAEPHPFTVRDLVALDRLSDPAVSPDGTRAVFTLSALDLEANRRRTDLYAADLQSGAVRRLTSHEASDTNAAFSPDGKTVYFLSTRSGTSQVHRLAVDGGEAEPVTRLPLDVSAFLLAPDGQRLVVALDVFVDCPTLACTRKRLDEAAARKGSGQIFDHLLFRHWDTWSDGRRSHLFVLPVGGGEPVDVMRGLDADAPSKPFGDVDEVAVTPDGRGLVFSARAAGREEAWSTNFDLYLAPLDGSAPPRSLTAKNLAWDTGPAFSPDGKTLAYRAMARPGYEADRFRVILRGWPDGAERVLAGAWDRSASSLLWARDGRTLYTTADDSGRHGLFAIDVASGQVRTVVAGGSVSAPVLAGGELVFALDHLRAPADLYAVKPDGAGLRQITHVNATRLGDVALGEPEELTFPGWNHEPVHAWIVKPVGFDPKRRYPVAFLIHGGPQGSFDDHFHYRWNPQVYAGAGYAAVMVDFHGSTGYGQAFSDAIRGDWGGKPLEDLQKGLAAALARHPWMDGSRACALGASFGGYMIYWIAGRWPDGFRCLVAHDGNLDERLAYYDTEELWFPEWDHKGTPWENPEAYGRHNPIDWVGRWKQPLLVIHGGKDYRVVETQGMSAFTAAQRRGIPSRFLHFPDENHWVLKPQNSILWHDTVLEWLARWTGPTGR